MDELSYQREQNSVSLWLGFPFQPSSWQSAHEHSEFGNGGSVGSMSHLKEISTRSC